MADVCGFLDRSEQKEMLRQHVSATFVVLEGPERAPKSSLSNGVRVPFGLEELRRQYVSAIFVVLGGPENIAE